MRRPSIRGTCVVLFLLLAPPTLRSQDNPESTRVKQDILWRKMEDSIQSLVRRSDAVIGIAIVDLTDQRSFFQNADAVFPTASTIKMAVLAELYRQDEKATADGAGAKLGDLYTMDPRDVVDESFILGGLTPGVSRVTNHDLSTMMVAVSDNGATNVLIDRVGMENVNTMLVRLGLKETRLRRRMLDVKAALAGRENTATPRELVTLLSALYSGRVFSKATTEAFFTMLSTGKDSYIPRLLPDAVRVANKPGALTAVRNDAGIVFVNNRPFAIAVMTTFGNDDLGSERTIAEISRAAWSYFDRVGGSSPLGRVVR